MPAPLTGMDLNVQSISHIDNRDYPGVDGLIWPGPYGYYTLIYFKPINLIPIVVFVLNNWLADGFLVGASFDARFTRPISNISPSSSSIVATWYIPRTSGSSHSLSSCTSALWVCIGFPTSSSGA